MMIRPVGVGRTSPGPIGVDGLTITAGSLCSATIDSTSRSATHLAVFVGADGFFGRKRMGFVARRRSGSGESVATLDV